MRRTCGTNFVFVQWPLDNEFGTLPADNIYTVIETPYRCVVRKDDTENIVMRGTNTLTLPDSKPRVEMAGIDHEALNGIYLYSACVYHAPSLLP